MVPTPELVEPQGKISLSISSSISYENFEIVTNACVLRYPRSTLTSQFQLWFRFK